MADERPLLPEAVGDLISRWGVRPFELARLLGTTPDAITDAVAYDREPADVGLQGALLAGALYFVLNERASRTGSDAEVAAWLDAPLEGERRAARLARAASIEEIGAALGLE